jgi:hypothetical protein
MPTGDDGGGQVLSVDRNRAVELLKQNKGNVDAAISSHFMSFK